MSQRDCLKSYVGKRVKARGFLRVISGLHGVALLDEVEVALESKWVLIEQFWLQRAGLMRFVKLNTHEPLEFTAKVYENEYPNCTKIGFRWPKHIRQLQGRQEPTEADDISMTIPTFNLLRSGQRKTEGQKRFAEVNGKWRRVIFVNQPFEEEKSGNTDETQSTSIAPWCSVQL